MFTPEAMDEPAPPAKEVGDLLRGLDVGGLLELRGQIDAMLPANNLKDLNLEVELVRSLQQTQYLASKVLNSEAIPTNQKAQVMNSCTSILDNLAKMQGRVYTSERLKNIEQMLIKAVRLLAVEAQVAFFAEYERLYGESGGNGSG